MIDIEEPVTFGDQKTSHILWNAVILDVEFQDPTENAKKTIYRNKHVFKVIKLDKAPQRETPMILGLPSICSHYLGLLVKTLRYGHRDLRQGLSLKDTLDEEIKRLRLRVNPVKILKRNQSLKSIVASETYLNDIDEKDDTDGESMVDDLDSLDSEVLEEVRKYYKVCNDPPLLCYNSQASLSYYDKLYHNELMHDYEPAPLKEKPVTILDVLFNSKELLLFWENDRQCEVLDEYFEEMEILGGKLSKFMKIKENNTPSHMNVEHLQQIKDAVDTCSTKQFDYEKYMADTIPPWTYHIEESPEERDSYIACDNTGLYNYLSTTHDEAMEKYLNDCKKNTSPEAWPYVRDILMSDLAKNQFCPAEWTGMTNIDPIDIQFSPEWDAVKQKGLGPKGTKAFVNEKMKEHYYKEFQRMQKYMYEPSNSSTASRILVADKATPPFVRICGDYRNVNKYVMLPQVTIPNIRNEIYRAREYKYYLNIDLANGFHNLPITKDTAEALALATEWGLFQPKFMPEGVRSAPQEFQRIMRKVFEPMKEHTIVIWDNILVMCNSLEEVASRLQEVLQLCKKHNIILKMAKTEIGFTEAAFFGYIVREKTIHLSQDRKDGINALKFFKNKKGAQSFLGSCNFFKDFVPNYSLHTSLLNDMVRNDFNWDRSTWKEDYEGAFENLKTQIQNAMTLHFPDYNKLWILRTDCSKDALGVVLFQVGDNGIYEPIAFHSQKLSDQAKNWAAVKLEAYAVYFAVKKLAYYLLGHTFVIEVDHANLVTMESSEQHIIQRWRSYLENFSFRIRHISGKQNLLADFQSRMFHVHSHLFQQLPYSDSTDDIYDHSWDDDFQLSYQGSTDSEDCSDFSFDPSYRAMLDLYDQRCFNLNENAYWFQPLEDIFEFASPSPQDDVQVYIRDPLKTTSYHVTSDKPLNHAFVLHDSSGFYNYFHDDDYLDGLDSFHDRGCKRNMIIDAIPSCFPVTTRSQRTHSAVEVEEGQSESVTPPIIPDAGVPLETTLERTATPIVVDNGNDDLADLIDPDLTANIIDDIQKIQLEVKDFMNQLHGRRKLHYGANRMYKEACKIYPGHRLPQQFFKDYVAQCAVCQKSRLQKDKLFLGRIRTLKNNPSPRSAVCIDRLSISPISKKGNSTVIVIADLFTRLVKIYPMKEYTSESVADCLKDWLITYGSYDVLQSDPGSDILGGAVDAINKRWKLGRKISLVARHESNGNERLIQEILRHLRCLVNDERSMDLWDDKDYIGFVTFCINNQVNSETNMTPYIATFGDRDAAYFMLPEVDRNSTLNSRTYVEELNKRLEIVRTLNAKYQQELHDERIAVTPIALQNQFRRDDLIWYRRPERIDKDGKLFFRNKGPYKVISVYKNDVECQHIVTNVIVKYHIDDVMPVNLETTYEELYEVAKRDQNQYMVISIKAWKGDITKRSTLQFLTEFDDGDIIWKYWNDPDFKLNSTLIQYLNAPGNQILTSLQYTFTEWKLRMKSLSNEPVEVFERCFVDYRSYNESWRNRVGLPDLDPPFKYVFEVRFVKFLNRAKTVAEAYIVNPKDNIEISRIWQVQFGMDLTFDSNKMVLIDEGLVQLYPNITKV